MSTPALTPPPAQSLAPPPSTPNYAGLSLRINAARHAGYSDNEIINHLQQKNPDIAPKIQAAYQHGYTAPEIANHLFTLGAPSAGFTDEPTPPPPPGNPITRFATNAFNASPLGVIKHYGVDM